MLSKLGAGWWVVLLTTSLVERDFRSVVVVCVALRALTVVTAPSPRGRQCHIASGDLKLLRWMIAARPRQRLPTSPVALRLPLQTASAASCS